MPLISALELLLYWYHAAFLFLLITRTRDFEKASPIDESFFATLLCSSIIAISLLETSLLLPVSGTFVLSGTAVEI